MRQGKRRTKKRSFEIRFYEELVSSQPDFIEALSCLGDAYTKGGLFAKGLEIDLRLIQLKPDDPIVYYNLACSQSLLGNIDAAFEALKKAILLGYDDFSYLAKDEDLKNLRQDLRFSKLMSKIKNRFMAVSRRKPSLERQKSSDL
jgi:tetratricopeptide (TPR) repeat protein